MFENVKNIIFDLDGTLVDSSQGVISATNYALEKMGENPRTDEEIMRFIGHPLDEMFAAFCNSPIDMLKSRFQEKAKETIIASAVPLPNVGDTLKKLYTAGYALALATTKFMDHTKGIIEKCGWDAYFAALVSGNEVERVKPAPDIVLLAMKRIGANPDETIMVGDTINDIQSAHSAGIRIIAVESPFGHNSDIQNDKPEMHIPHVVNLLDILKV